MRIKYQDSEKDKGRTDLELTAAGYDYSVIQKKVNEILK